MKRDKKWAKNEVIKLWGRWMAGSDTIHELNNSVISIIDKLDEPEKIVIPQFVADWIEKAKETEYPLAYAINQTSGELGKWLHTYDQDVDIRKNQELFAKAWVDGYEVEKEPTWVVKAVSGDYVDRFFNRGTSIQVFISSGVYMTEAHKFEDKSHADAVALLIKGTVEEL